VAMVGRVTLIKSVLSSMLLFLIKFKMPHFVIKEVTKLERKFLWDSGYEGKRWLGLSGKRFVRVRKVVI